MGILALKMVDLTNPEIAMRIFRELNALGSSDPNRACLSVSCEKIGAFRTILQRSALPITMFGWANVFVEQTMRWEEIQDASELWLASGSVQIQAVEDLALPFYDWDEAASDNRIIWIIARCSRHEEETTKERLRGCIEKVAQTIGVNMESDSIKATTSFRSDHIRVMLGLRRVPKSLAALAVTELTKKLEISEAILACAFIGALERIATIYEAGVWRTSNFPDQVHPTGIFRGAFSIEPRGMLRCVKNADLFEDELKLRAIWQDSQNFSLVMIGREFLGWKIGGVIYPRTQGNYLKLWLENGRPKFEVGVEQFASKDPPTKPVVGALRGIAAAYGGELK